MRDLVIEAFLLSKIHFSGTNVVNSIIFNSRQVKLFFTRMHVNLLQNVSSEDPTYLLTCFSIFLKLDSQLNIHMYVRGSEVEEI